MVFSLEFSTSKGLLRTLPSYCFTVAFPTLAVPQLPDVPALPSCRLWLPFPAPSQPWVQQSLCRGRRLPPACEGQCPLLPAPSWGTWLAQLGLKPAQLTSCKENLWVAKSAAASGRIIVLTHTREVSTFLYVFSERIQRGFPGLLWANRLKTWSNDRIFPLWRHRSSDFPLQGKPYSLLPMLSLSFSPTQCNLMLHWLSKLYRRMQTSGCWQSVSQMANTLASFFFKMKGSILKPVKRILENWFEHNKVNRSSYIFILYCPLLRMDPSAEKKNLNCSY